MPFMGVAVTTTLPIKLTPELTLLPFHPKGICRTGLNKRCAVKCDWLVILRHEMILRFLGRTPPETLTEIVEFIQSHGDY